MHLSRYFAPILRETPKEAEIVSHQLMLRAGMIRQASAGIYSWLPLGLRVERPVVQEPIEARDVVLRQELGQAGDHAPPIAILVHFPHGQRRADLEGIELGRDVSIFGYVLTGKKGRVL